MTDTPKHPIDELVELMYAPNDRPDALRDRLRWTINGSWHVFMNWLYAMHDDPMHQTKIHEYCDRVRAFETRAAEAFRRWDNREICECGVWIALDDLSDAYCDASDEMMTIVGNSTDDITANP